MPAWLPYLVSLLIFVGLVFGVVYQVVPTNELSVVAGPLPTPIQHVILIMMENLATATVVGGGGVPYQTSLSQAYAWGGTNYYAICHPSTGNYIALTSMQPLHCGSDGPPVAPYYSVNNIYNQLNTAGKSWTEYEEAATQPCQLTSSGLYATRHTAAPYYADLNPGGSGSCQTNDIPISSLVNNFPYAQTPGDFTFIVPNLNNDAHNTNAQTGDTWLASFVPKLIAQSWFSRSVIFITYDESGSPQLNTGPGTDGGGPVPMFAVSPYSAGLGALTGTHDHYDLLATMEWLLGVPQLAGGNGAYTPAPMTSLFSFGTCTKCAAGLSAGLSVSPSSIKTGATATFTATASGGAPPYSYAYSGLPGGCGTATGTTVTCEPSIPGTYAASVVVTDSAGSIATAGATLSVTSPTSTLLAALSVSPSSPAYNTTYTLTVAPTGGKSPYSYEWSSVPGGCTGLPTSTLTCSGTNPGPQEAVVLVTDSAGATSLANLNFTVAGGPGPGPSIFPAITEQTYIGIAASGGIALGILIAWALRRPEWGVSIAVVSAVVLVVL